MADQAGQDPEPEGSDAQQGHEPQDGKTPDGTAQDDKSAADWQALARKWERQANKDRADLVTLKKQVQGLLTPEQVADKTAAATQAQQAAAAAAHEALRLRIALEKGVPADLADRLIGEDRAALEADAATLLALLKASPGTRTTSDAAAGTGKPTPKVPVKPDPNALLRMMAGRA